MKHLRWGIIATGQIGRRFAEGLATVDQASVVAVGSRDKAKADAFAEKYGLPRAYGSYEEVFGDPEVDAVYIATPNDTHASLAIAAARAGKHILCEKPVTMDAAELEAVLEVVRAEDVFFMEAFMYRCHPQMAKLREVLAAGTIGEVRVIHASFAFNMGYRMESTRMVNRLGGGGLYDVGCYCVSFCRMAAGEEPTALHAVAKIGEESRVDEWATGCLGFPSGITAVFTCALRCGTPNEAIVFGDKGSARVPNPWIPPTGAGQVIVEAGGETVVHETPLEIDLYANEALTVAKHLDDRQAPQMNWDDSLGQMRALDALRASMGLAWEA